MADLRVLASARQSPDCLRDAVRNRPLRGSRPIGKRIRRSESECRAQLGSSESHPSRCRPKSKPRLAFSTTREGPAGRSSFAPAHSPVPPAAPIANPRRPAVSLPASALLPPFAPSRTRALARPPRTRPASFATLASHAPLCLSACAALRVAVRGPPRRNNRLLASVSNHSGVNVVASH